MNTKDRLEKEIERLHKVMADLDPNSEEYAKLEDNLTKLMDRLIEIEKHEASVAESKKDRISRCINDNLKWAIPLGVSVGMSFLAMYAEAKGVVPFGVGKKWIDKVTKY